MKQYNISDGYILGIDAALSNFGISVHKIDNYKDTLVELILLKTKREKRPYKNFDDLTRCQFLHIEIRKIIQQYDVKALFAELPQSGGQHMQADSMIYSGAIMGILSSFSIPTYFYPTKDVKNAVLGFSTSDKQVMIDKMVTLYPDANWKKYKRHGEMLLSADNEHLADALAVVEYAKIFDQTKKDLLVLK